MPSASHRFANRKGQHTMAAVLAAMAVWRDRRADLGLALMSRRFPPPWSVDART
jgi:hypothetical protein